MAYDRSLVPNRPGGGILVRATTERGPGRRKLVTRRMGSFPYAIVNERSYVGRDIGAITGAAWWFEPSSRVLGSKGDARVYNGTGLTDVVVLFKSL